MVAVDDDEREVPFQLVVGLAHGRGEVALVVPLDEVDDDLRVGLGMERVPLRQERLLELAVVLHDPVQHDGQLALRAAGERVRVRLRDGAVRGPARMAEPVRDPLAVMLGGLAD